MIKILLVAAAMLAAVVTPASAGTLKKSGYWEAYTTATDSGTPVVGMATYGDNARRSFHVKYYSGNQHLTVQIFKDGWKFPTNQAIDVPLEIRFDNGQTYPVIGRARYNQQAMLAKIEAHFEDPEEAGEFVANIMAAKQMQIHFLEGDEGYWTVNMHGSREVAMAFTRVMKAAPPKVTQPYGNGNGNATQPFGKKKDVGI